MLGTEFDDKSFSGTAGYLKTSMKILDHLIVFSLDRQLYALPLQVVDRVVRMVAITPLPKAPEIVLGVVNFQGRVIPVINMRRRFRLPEKEIALTDQLVVAHTSKRPVALVADEVHDVIAGSAQRLFEIELILPGVEHVDGVIKLEDGLILIHDLDKFLSLEEERSLNQALKTS